MYDAHLSRHTLLFRQTPIQKSHLCLVVSGRSGEDFRRRLLHAYLLGGSSNRRRGVHAGARTVAGDQAARASPPCGGAASPHGSQTPPPDGFVYRQSAHTPPERLPERSSCDGFALVPAVGRGRKTTRTGIVTEGFC